MHLKRLVKVSMLGSSTNKKSKSNLLIQNLSRVVRALIELKISSLIYLNLFNKILSFHRREVYLVNQLMRL